jgi:hypothetical protein
MAQLNTFRRSRRARGVHDHRYVIRLDLTPRVVDVRATVQLGEGDGACCLAVDQHHLGGKVGGQSLWQKRGFSHQHVGAGIAHQPCNVLWRQCGVDRQADRTQVQDGGVHNMKRRTIAQQHCDSASAAHSQSRQSACHSGDLGGVIAPGQPFTIVDRPQRHPVGAGRGRCLEYRRDRRLIC